MTLSLSCRDLTKNFDQRGLSALKNIDLEFALGKTTAVIGPSGTGKTTLLNILAGELEQDAGGVYLQGILSDQQKRRDALSYIPQEWQLPKELVVRTYFESQAKKYGATWEDIRFLVEIFHLQSEFEKKIGDLSTGQKSRVTLVVHLLPKRSLLLLDEPFAHLDRPLQRQIEAELKEVQKNWGTTIIMVTHQLEQALEWAHDIVVLMDGKVRYHGNCEELYFYPPDAPTASFLGETNLVASQILKIHEDWVVLKNALGEFRVDASRYINKMSNQKFGYLLIRADDITLDYELKGQAQVTQVRFLGAWREVVVVSHSLTLTIRQSSREKVPQVGQKIGLEFNPKGLGFLPL